MKISRTISERVEEVRAEANAFIDKRAADLAKLYPGVPFAMHRQTITRGMGCACAAALLVSNEIEKETAYGTSEWIGRSSFHGRDPTTAALIERIAQQRGTTPEAALSRLDAQDAHAIEIAERILTAEPYTDILVPHAYH